MIRSSTYRLLFQCFITIVILAAVQTCMFAQVSPFDYDYPHNHLPWYTIESDHFLVHYQEGSSRSAQVASVIAEEIYEPVTTLYGHHPRKKVSIVLRDREDFSNGAAFFFDDKIEIWTPSLDTPLRGTHNWLRNVITHEFVHIVQLGASMKRSQTIPAIYFQWLNYEDVRRPDVLYGFPNGLITMPFATVGVPAWFAEGTAQYQRSGYEFDYWDSHRDMILRTRILSDSYLDFFEMGTFTSKTSFEREVVYNQGFAFTIYLVNRFGEKVIADISYAAANSGKNNFSKVIKTATGYTGEELFTDWIEDRKEYYTSDNERTGSAESETVEKKGFFNFYPQVTPDGQWIGYLTNHNRDYGRTFLFFKKGNKEVEINDLGGPEMLERGQLYDLSHGIRSNAALDFISNRFSFSPIGPAVTYSRSKTNRYGETYQDIYIYNFETEENRQLTENRRVQDPAWHPNGHLIAAIQQRDGTQNLVLLNSETGQLSELSNFNSGQTLFTPVWSPDGASIYFAASLTGNRNLYRYSIETEEIEPLFENRYIDYRDPWIDPSGTYLYYSSDISGAFNLYRLHLHEQVVHQLTDVTGGAFMPFVHDNNLYYSEFKAGGYKIKKIPGFIIKEATNYYSDDPSVSSGSSEIIIIDMEDNIASIYPEKINSGSDEIHFQIDSTAGRHERIWRPYSETITGLSIYPVIRFDNYTKLRGGNSALFRNGQIGLLGENLWRDMKLGAYFSSRDVTENLSLFGGALIGPGSVPSDGIGGFLSPSRINDLDRDLFFIAEHRGIPFINRRWSPTVSIELYNIKRNVRDGITVEEFPCTSCLPADRSIDIRYHIWEANLFLRSKMNRWSLLELGLAYSPYSVSTAGFFSQEFREFIPSSTSRYFRGRTYSASYIAELVEPTRHQDAASIGMKGSLTYRYQPGRLLDEFEISDGTLSPVFTRDRNHSLELILRSGFGLTENYTGMITTRAFGYLNNPEDFFYQDYIGGMIGMRSYPYFALGGQRTAFLRASLLRPIFTGINRQAGAYTLDKVFGHLFFETGNGWGGPLNIGSNLKTGIGAELRFAFNSYYLFPMKFFMNGTYGFSSFDIELPGQFITTGESDRVRYGKEFLFYFGLTFDFDLL